VIRIPVELSFDTDTVTLEKSGDALIVRPVRPPGWERFLADRSLVLPEDLSMIGDVDPQDRDLF
jgi:virulence-associated protein VagC